MSKAIRLSVRLPVKPEVIYRAWLSSRGHTAMTGGKAKMSARKGARYAAWGKYIKGRNLALKRPSRIVQSWRGSSFPKGAPESRLEVRIVPAGNGSKLTLIHSKLPRGEAGHLRKGWRSHYLVPMKKYFTKLARKTR
jgi:activator of HSP90 ATPase